MARDALYIKSNDMPNPIEIAIHKTTGIFQLGPCLATNNGFIPLDIPGTEYDSGLRVTISGKDYQVCSNITGDLLLSRLCTDNLILPADDISIVYSALSRLLGLSRVKLGNGGIINITVPPRVAHITKLLIYGAGAVLKLDNDVTLQSTVNGWNISQIGGDKQRLGKVLVLSLEPGRHFSFELDKLKWTSAEDMHVGIALGYAVEALPDMVSTVDSIINAPNWCTWKNSEFVHVTDNQDTINMWNKAKSRIAYKGGNNKYNYYSMTDVKVLIKKER